LSDGQLRWPGSLKGGSMDEHPSRPAVAASGAGIPISFNQLKKHTFVGTQ
jgi:hypothetical protein